MSEHPPCVSWHARERMAERHGRDLTYAEWVSAVADILERRAVLLSAHGDVQCWAVTVGPIVLRMMWSPGTANVMTVLADEQTHAGHHAQRAMRAPIKPRYEDLRRAAR